MIKTLSSEKQLRAASNLKDECPGFANFHDLFRSRLEKGEASYRVFTNESGSLAFLSHASHLNLYGAGSLRSFWSEWREEMTETRLSAVFGLEEVEELLKEDKEMGVLISRRLRWALYSLKPSGMTDQGRLEVRPFQSHEQVYLDQWYAAFNSEHDSNWSVPQLKDHPEEGLYIVWNEKNEFVGACASPLPNRERFWVGRLYVFPQYRRRGYAREIMQSLMSLAYEHKKEVCLHLSPGNLAAHSLYEALGFQERAKMFGAILSSL